MHNTADVLVRWKFTSRIIQDPIYHGAGAKERRLGGDAGGIPISLFRLFVLPHQYHLLLFNQLLECDRTEP